MEEIVQFCMRCFDISAVPVDKDINFCHNCGSEGTCINMERKDASYLIDNIQHAINIVVKNNK